MYVNVWNRSEILRKSKISQGVKPDYYDRVSNSRKFASKVSLMYLDVWNRNEIIRKSKISQGVKPDYYDQISKSSKFPDIVNFYSIL